ncbi:conserved hypothetical protein [Tenacibaculum litoreum]|uniref:hypothetical protein n=1 Tax=Tenacibaculum litoreum TaxID=321269 RepID=UPI003895664F
MSKTFYFYKGDINSVSYDFDPSTKLNDIRKELVAKGFMTASESTNNFRFINYQNSGLKYEDMVVGIGTEQYIPLNAISGINDQAYLTNVNKTKAVDLIGFNTNWWFDRYMSCKMTLNTIDPEAQTANKGKFQPFMLTNVKTANPNLPGVTMDNVVVCEKDSIVQFNISSWGSAGYGYKIKPISGAPINNENLYITFTSCPTNGGNYGSSSLRRYFSTNESQNNSTIKVVATESLNLGGKTLNYMKFSIKTWKVTSYKSGGKTYNCNLPLPVPQQQKAPSNLMARSIKTDVGTGSITPYNKLVNADESVVPGGTIEPGTTVPSGQQSTQNIGTIYNVKDSQAPENIIGEVIFYIFVFKSHEDAVAVFGKMNDINPSVWGS